MPDPQNMPCTLKAEIFSVGEWNGETFHVVDLEEIARNFALLREVIKPPLKFGHDVKQTLLGQEDGDPALGWVETVWVQGEKLFARFRQVPFIVCQSVYAGRYRSISAEIDLDYRHEGRSLGKVLKAVALLGADLPAVTNLRDLSTFLAAEKRPTEQSSLACEAAPVAAHSSAAHVAGQAPSNRSVLLNELNALRAYKLDQEQRLQSEAQQQRHTAFQSARKSALAFCEEQVQAGVLAPALRDSLMQAIDSQTRHFRQGAPLNVPLEWVMDFVRRMPSILSSGEMAFAAEEGPLCPAGDPSQRLAALAKQKMLELRVDYNQAAEHVLRTHPQLAQAYRTYTLHPTGV